MCHFQNIEVSHTYVTASPSAVSSLSVGSFPRRDVKSSPTLQRNGLSFVYSPSSVPSSQKPIIVSAREKAGIFFKPKTSQVDGSKKPTTLTVKFPTPFNHKTKQGIYYLYHHSIMQSCSGSSTVQTILVAQASTNKMTVSVRYVQYSKSAMMCCRIAAGLQTTKAP